MPEENLGAKPLMDKVMAAYNKALGEMVLKAKETPWVVHKFIYQVTGMVQGVASSSGKSMTYMLSDGDLVIARQVYEFFPDDAPLDIAISLAKQLTEMRIAKQQQLEVASRVPNPPAEPADAQP